QSFAAASQTTVCTGIATAALAVPGGPQMSVEPLPTFTSTCRSSSDPEPVLQYGVCGSLQISGELVSASSDTVKSEPPFESIRPTPHPVCDSVIVKLRAGTQNGDMTNPPGSGTTVSCTQFASPAPTSCTILPPAGRAN